jgi:hypothetical protein
MNQAKPVIDTKSEVAALASYPVGKTVLPVVDIPIDTKETLLSVSRENWPDLGPETPVVLIEQYFSFDNEATWVFGGSSLNAGGAWRHRDGYIMPEIPFRVPDIPDPKNPDRKLRVEIHALQPLTSKISLEPRSKNTIPDVQVKG